MDRNRLARGGMAGVAALLGSLLISSGPAAAAPLPLASAVVLPPADTAAVTTWEHADAVATSGPIADDQVRQSPFYEVAVAAAPAGTDRSQHKRFQ